MRFVEIWNHVLSGWGSDSAVSSPYYRPLCIAFILANNCRLFSQIGHPIYAAASHCLKTFQIEQPFVPQSIQNLNFPFLLQSIFHFRCIRTLEIHMVFNNNALLELGAVCFFVEGKLGTRIISAALKSRILLHFLLFYKKRDYHRLWTNWPAINKH